MMLVISKRKVKYNGFINESPWTFCTQVVGTVDDQSIREVTFRLLLSKKNIYRFQYIFT